MNGLVESQIPCPNPDCKHRCGRRPFSRPPPVPSMGSTTICELGHYDDRLGWDADAGGERREREERTGHTHSHAAPPAESSCPSLAARFSARLPHLPSPPSHLRPVRTSNDPLILNSPPVHVRAGRARVTFYCAYEERKLPEVRLLSFVRTP